MQPMKRDKGETESKTKRRLRALVEEIKREIGDGYGWRTAVGERIDMSPGFMTKVLGDPAKDIGRETVDRISRKLRLHESYWLGEGEPASYKAYVRGAPSGTMPAARPTSVPPPDPSRLRRIASDLANASEEDPNLTMAAYALAFELQILQERITRSESADMAIEAARDVARAILS